MSRLKKTRSRIHLFSGAVIMLVLALGFNILLTSVTFEKLYVETFISKNNVVVKDLQRNLATALRFGKSVDKFIGMDKLILEARQHLVPAQKETGKSGTDEDDIVISITYPDGHVIYSSSAQVVGTYLPEAVRLPLPKGTQPSVERHAVEHKGVYYISLPVKHGFSKKWVATVTVAFSQKQVKAMLRGIVMKSIKLIAAVLFSAMTLLIIFLRSLTLDPNISEKSLRRIKFKISATFFIIICLAQITLNLFNLFEFRAHLLDVSTQKSVVMSKLLKQDIEYLLAKGLNIRRLIKMDQKLDDIIAVSPELEGITISDNTGRPLYIAGRHGMRNLTNFENNESQNNGMRSLHNYPGYTVTQNLLNTRKSETGTLDGKLTIHISKNFLFNKLKAITLDSITVLVISIFFFVELLILKRQLIERQITGD
ncbi:MAG TPA: MFS transporter, partial [Desulfobacter sp.]|nr:MFS transporter [Desulfobacter sp.]